MLFDRADEALKKHGKDYISRTTRRSLIAFWAFEDNLPTCKGPREIAWERDTDYGFVIALADVTSGKFNGKEVDFRMGYGFRPTAKAVNPTVSERAPGATPGG